MRIATIILLVVWVSGAAASDLLVPIDFPDLRAAVNAAVPGDTIYLVVEGDWSDGQRIDAPWVSIVGLGPELSQIHGDFSLSGDYVLRLGSRAEEMLVYKQDTRVEGLKIYGQTGCGLNIYPTSGVALTVRQVVFDCTLTACCVSAVGDSDGAVVLEHLTFLGARAGVQVNNGAVTLMNSVLAQCGTAVFYDSRLGGTLNNSFNLFDSNGLDYQADAMPGDGEFPGVANLNDVFMPIPDSDALNRATDEHPDLGALQFEWTQLGDLHFLMDDHPIIGFPYLSPGDTVALDVQLAHNVPGYVDIVTYVVLSVAGEFYFWPSWQQFVPSDPSTIDSSTVEFHAGDVAEVLHCTLPESGWDSMFTVDFYAAGAFPGAEFSLVTTLATTQFAFGV